MGFSKVFDMAESVLSSSKMSSSLQQSISGAKALFQGKSLCYQLGLFKLGFDVPSLMSYSFPMDSKQQVTINNF